MKTIKIYLIFFFGAMFIKQSFTQNITNENAIFYYDFVPDSQLVSPVDTLKIDINQDRVLDIAFYLVQTSGGDYCYVRSINKNCEFSFFPSEYCSDSLTCDSLKWRIADLPWIEYYSGNKLALRFTINNNFYYGWLKGYQLYDSNNSKAFYIDKYAFCTIPDYPLLWGQTTLTGIEEPGLVKTVRAFVNQPEKQITVEADKKIKQVKLVNMNGATVTTIKKVNTTSATLNTAGLPGGAYLVQVTLNNGNVQTVKVLLE
ncbi:MAG: T9SS type A sorting domain-containing protein [Prolixibacteraceae bacterium]|nr:T9SS type A sorting domain-containing protein [Prolixibacteraceae bacterium]